MDIGQAVAALKGGEKVARAGWNGKNMFLYYVPPGAYPTRTNAARSHFGKDALVPYTAYVVMKTVQEDVVPWLCSQTDLLADDWTIVE